MRLTPALIVQDLSQQSGTTGSPLDQAAIAVSLRATLADHEGDRKRDDVLAAIVNLAILPDALRDRLKKLQRSPDQSSDGRESRKGRLETEFDAYGRDGDERPRGIVFTAPRGLRTKDAREDEAALPITESEEFSAGGGQAITLLNHCEHVRNWARGFSERAGLSDAICGDIALSGFLHDPGKADPRWQTYAVGGAPYGADMKEVLAKSGRRSPKGAWGRAGLPDDWRHEALSVRLTMIHPDFRQARDPALMLWLIGTHHGFGRPLFPHAPRPRPSFGRDRLSCHKAPCR